MGVRHWKGLSGSRAVASMSVSDLLFVLVLCAGTMGEGANGDTGVVSC